MQAIDTYLEGSIKIRAAHLGPVSQLIKDGLVGVLKGVIVLVPQRERQCLDLLWIPGVGLETQKVCDAVLNSAKSGAWTNVG